MFYRTLSRVIEPLLGGPHIESLDTKIENNFVNKDGVACLVSDRTTTLVFHTNNDATIDVGFTREMRSIAGLANSSLYELRRLEVDGDELPVASLEHEDRGATIQFRYVHDSAMVANDTLRVYIKERLVLPTNDVIYWKVREDRSLRRLNVHCKFDLPVHPQLLVYGFPADGAARRPNQYEDSCDIEWEGWMIPHHNFTIKWDSPDAAEIPRRDVHEGPQAVCLRAHES